MTRYAIIVLILLFAKRAHCCSCSYMGGFLKVAPQTSLVAMVKVNRFLTYKTINGKQTPMSMEVTVKSVYMGKTTQKKLVVWGDPGNLCRPYLSVFKKGGVYLIAFIPAGKGANENQGDFAISVCGTYWLPVNKKDKTATGDITHNDQTSSTMLLKDIRVRLQQTAAAKS